jgi:hypothetical protein
MDHTIIYGSDMTNYFMSPLQAADERVEYL